MGTIAREEKQETGWGHWDRKVARGRDKPSLGARCDSAEFLEVSTALLSAGPSATQVGTRTI